MRTITTDYLVVGAGASGMAFADALIADSDADVVLVDRQHRSGGHWNRAYPFVRLHQPSAYYGVNSTRLGADRIDGSGPNQGFYERATADEVVAYYQAVLEDRLLGSGRVRFYGMTDHVEEGPTGSRLRSRLDGSETEVRVRRKLVDATYLEGEVPSRHALPFEVGEGVRVVPPNQLVDAGVWDGSVAGYTVLGSGKTGMDACNWLLDNGVPVELIRWVRPREAWWFDRELVQPLDLVASVIEGVSLELEAAAEAADLPELFERLESSGRLLRVDAEVEPTMFRGATVSRQEVESLHRVSDVVRSGRVLRIDSDQMATTGGPVPSRRGELYVDCTAAGLSRNPPRPIFEADRITVQTVRIGLTPFNAAMLGFIEATRHDDAEKNRLCPPNVYPWSAADWVPTTYISTLAETRWGEEPDIAEWLEGARLNLASGLRSHIHEPRMQTAITRLLTHREPALDNLRRLAGAAGTTPPAL